MNLGKKYKQLFEGKARSNDSSLIKEHVNPEVDKAYGAVYDLTDVHGDSALELMNDFVDSAGLTDVLDKFLDDIKLTPKESTALIDVLIDVADELSI
jgi:hypothetical protein